MPMMNGSHTDPGYFSQKLTTLFCYWVANELSESNQQVDNEKIITAFGRLELEWCERKILLGWLELELVAGVV